MNKIQIFRKILAEQGIEMTIEEAEQAFKNANKFIKRSKKISIMDIWEMQKTEVENISAEEKDQLINLYKKAKEL
jgi:1,2-phenylacetyl-CoA epoxidase PaaB subunit